jgi:hypothetical membrane protein
MKQNLVIGSSLVLVVFYLVFSLVSVSLFPGPFSPLQNWLSDLGNPQSNPQGAIYYNIGILVTGAAMLSFFIGLGLWKLPGHKAQNIMLLLTRLFGCLGALAMVLSAIFPISTPAWHSFWSAALYILTGTAFAFLAAALRYFPQIPKWVFFAGVFVAIEDLVWSLVLNTYPMEWLTVFLFLGYVLLVGLETKRLAGSTNDRIMRDVSREVNHV